MYPIMLPGNTRDNDGFSSFRTPDGYFPERRGTPPDPIGSLFVRLLERISDRWEDFRRPKDQGAIEARHDDGRVDAAPALPGR